MKCVFENIKLICKKDEIQIDFSPKVNFFWGQISAGKSSIVRLIDYCLGGQLEKTPAISQELLSVELRANMGDNKVSFLRETQDSNKVQVTWVNTKGERLNLLAPIQSSRRGNPIYGRDIYTLSDLILHFFNISPFKVHVSRKIGDPRLATLSFRDIMWYCYLKQEFLDSSFYRLERPPHMYKSRYAFMFIIGLYSEKLSQLEKELSEIKAEYFNREEELNKIISFLEPFGYDNVYDIEDEIKHAADRLIEIRNQIELLQSEYMSETNFADELRANIIELEKKIIEQQSLCFDIENKLNEQNILNNELIISQDKIDRLDYAKNVLDDVPYLYCPACGKKITNINDDPICYLCKNEHDDKQKEVSINKEVIKRDIYNRIIELNESIKRHEYSLEEQHGILNDLKEIKVQLDNKLDQMMKEYNSRYLINARLLERDLAKYEEQISNLNKIKEIPLTITENEKYIMKLKINDDELQKQINYEKQKLKDTKNVILELEDIFLDSLLRVKVPGINEEDKIRINRKTWIPEVLPLGDESRKYSFSNAGSAGKKTLFNVCYALSIHCIAREYDLKLPTFLIIDTPMKNIGEDVNKEIFEAFYNYLYELVESTMNDTQFIIIDKEYFPPKSKDIEVISRYMTPENDDNPPLIPYYRGP